jgi:exonuclease SbcC
VLGALSEGEMTVQFRFQRETKAGKPRETLEVLVRPHDGEPREFAMFSGGEAFRIAFAVRLALSKLLTRRAGARLQTLVIDEGFGSQDPQGRERLVEAINVARTEFSKVLVVTHLEELKDQFPVRIQVSRDARGSTLQLSGA